ncbi:MAG: LytTR family DNA-binding domain-containing protein [Clostridia bacterium]|nr:LytTR family DNA-binding domain-containing protein [Clostridia bacterium]
MINIAIVDDDKSFCGIITKKIINACEQLDIECNTESFYNDDIIKRCMEMDLIFLDIGMGNISGIDVAKDIIRKTKATKLPLIIFLTSMDHLVFSALKVIPFSYIRKVDLESSLLPNIKEAVEAINLYRKEREKYTIRCGRTAYTVFLDDIYYIDNYKNYVYFHTVQGDFKERTLLSQIDQKLCDKGFYRINSGCLVNRVHIFSSAKKEIILDNGVSLNISDGFKDVTEKILKDMVNDYD